MIAWLDHPVRFPSVENALPEPNGLLAAGGALTPEYLLIAYRSGIFPWFMPGEPILWWSPDPRTVLFPHEFHVPRSLAKTVRHRPYVIRFDSAFREVMKACAAPRADGAGTWIGTEVIDGYCALHQLGYAHSIETWVDGELVGGLYGVALGGVFYGESMFARQSDASKIAFSHLIPWLAQTGFGLIDCQMHTHHLVRFGARDISRNAFGVLLANLVDQVRIPHKWDYEFVNTGRLT